MSWSPGQDILVASVFRQSSQSPNHANEAVSESSENRQSKPIREATPRPEQATHKQRIDGLELSKLGHLRINYGPVTLFKKNSKRNTYLVGFMSNGRTSFNTDENKTRQFVKGLRVELQRALAPLPPMGFAAARKTTIRSAATSYKRPGQGPWKPKDFKRSRGEQRTGNKGRPTLIPGGAHRVCTYCGRSGHVAEMCYQKSRLCYRCEKPGHVRDHCPEMQQVPPETSRRLSDTRL
ncbi:hypothetical protein M9H77_11892 [Catharanthus roseus]|uniref:Uncharacterized protein n=1 Tax=Catharanthus roseus TaxID=4058 RepID=A0ACC0BG20_CATRO|nr:hypothetical protein M9H77_11892 [Catharanthus roseus]